MLVKTEIASQIPATRNRIRKLVKEYGDVKVDEVTMAQVFGGIRGVKCLATDISYVGEEGLHLRGYTIPELLQELPRKEGAEFPLAGGMYYLLLTGKMPSMDEALSIEEEWKTRNGLPEYVRNVLISMPEDAHPMTMFSQGILAMQNDSQFVNLYQEGLSKDRYWEPTLEDSLDLTARLPALAAFIYNLKYRDGKYIPPDPELDWSTNFVHMIGKGDEKGLSELIRLYFVIHSDHESGNASAHATHLVGSTLSDVYYASCAGMNALAGPLHGLANQECLRWLLQMREVIGHFPTKDEIEAYAWDTLNSGKVIPGYGHAVLRKPDPRFIALLEFGEKHMPEDENLKMVRMVYEVVPGVLQKLGKVSNPWPNVDAVSGSTLYHYGIKEFNFYTVLFGVSRVMGVSANLIWSRILNLPIERPKSLTTHMLESIVADAETEMTKPSRRFANHIRTTFE